MTKSFEYKGHTYNFFMGWGTNYDIEIVKTFLDDKKLPDCSYCVIIHDGADLDSLRHQKIPTMSGLKTYCGPIIHRGPYFTDEQGNAYQMFISHKWTGEKLTFRQKKHIREEFEKFVFKMRNVKSIHYYYQDEIKTPKHKLKFTFYDYCNNEEDKQLVRAYKFNKFLPDVSFCVVKYNGSLNWSSHDLVFRHETLTPLVYRGPVFHDDEGNDYEIIVSKKWRGEKLNQSQKDDLMVAFKEIAGLNFKRRYIENIEYYWQTGNKF